MVIEIGMTYSRELTNMVTLDASQHSSCHRCAECTATQKAIPPKEIQKGNEQLLHIRQMRKYHQNGQERLKHSHHKPHPAVPYIQERIPNSQLLEQRIWASPVVPQLLKFLPERDGLPKHVALKTNGACIHKTQYYNKEVKILNRHANTHHDA